MKTNDQWLSEFMSIHGDTYDYSLMPIGVRSTTSFDIICQVHGVFRQSPTNHKRGKGCPQCVIESFRIDEHTKIQRSRRRERQYRASGRRSEAQRIAYSKMTDKQKQSIIDRNTSRYHRVKHSVESKTSVTCRSLVQRSIMAAAATKTMRTEECLGYTFEQFRDHIESLFTNGMRWDNHGEWHVDHIKPISVFIREGVTDPSIINALTNLQPLLALDNLRKSDRYSSP